MTVKIKNEIKNIREKIDGYLAMVGADLEANIKLGNIRFDQDEDGNLTSFTSQIKFEKRGMVDKREKRYQDWIERLIKNKLIKKSQVPTCYIERGKDMSFVGLDLKKPKNLFMIRSADGKTYHAGMGYFLGKCFDNGLKKPITNDEYNIVEGEFRKWLFMGF